MPQYVAKFYPDEGGASLADPDDMGPFPTLEAARGKVRQTIGGDYGSWRPDKWDLAGGNPAAAPLPVVEAWHMGEYEGCGGWAIVTEPDHFQPEGED